MIPRDIEYWQNLENPLIIPNEDEFWTFKQLRKGKVLMLGETKELMFLADDAVDIHPCGKYNKTFKADWYDLKGHWDTIIGDGVLNLCDVDLVDVLSKACDRLIIRVFEDWVHNWKYATYFPTTFKGSSRIIQTRPGCRIVVWNFIKT